MAMSSSSGFEQWGYGIGRSRHGRHGKTDTPRGSSVQSDGIVLTMLLCSANSISAICSILIKNITTRLGRTCRCTRTRRCRVPFTLPVARWRCQFWADAPPIFQSVSFRPGQASNRELHQQSAERAARRARRTSFRPACLSVAASSCGSIPSASIKALTMESDKISLSVGSR